MNRSIDRVGYLGPPGTFTHQALLTQNDLSVQNLVPLRTIWDVFDAVSCKEIDYGFVPIENSIEGIVNHTQDALVFDYDLLIQREVVLDIEHCLMGRPGFKLGDAKKLLSMPVAIAQCHAYIRRVLPEVVIEETRSTAEAARLVSEETAIPMIALGHRSAAELYGLEVFAEQIADHNENQTRFIVVARDIIPKATGHDRTGLVVFQRADEPGSLISILQEFAARRINLSNLLSRPTKRGGLGDYCFIMYADGHIEDELVADALRELHAKQGSVKFLGSYPAAGVHAHSAREHADARWREADDWVGELRSRIIR